MYMVKENNPIHTLPELFKNLFIKAKTFDMDIMLVIIRAPKKTKL